MKTMAVMIVVTMIAFGVLIFGVDDNAHRAERSDVVEALHGTTCSTSDGAATLHWDLLTDGAELTLRESSGGAAPAPWRRLMDTGEGESNSSGTETRRFPAPGERWRRERGRRRISTDFHGDGHNAVERHLPDGPPRRLWIVSEQVALGTRPEAGAQVRGDSLALIAWAPGQVRMYHRPVRYRPSDNQTFRRGTGAPGASMDGGWTAWDCWRTDEETDG